MPQSMGEWGRPPYRPDVYVLDYGLSGSDRLAFVASLYEFRAGFIADLRDRLAEELRVNVDGLAASGGPAVWRWMIDHLDHLLEATWNPDFVARPGRRPPGAHDALDKGDTT